MEYDREPRDMWGKDTEPSAETESSASVPPPSGAPIGDLPKPPPSGAPVGDLPEPVPPPSGQPLRDLPDDPTKTDPSGGQLPPVKARSSGSPSFGNSVARPDSEKPEPASSGGSASADSRGSTSEVPPSSRTKGDRNASSEVPDSNVASNAQPAVDLPRGPYTKGDLWKWGSRVAGFGTLAVLLFLIAQWFGLAFLCLLMSVGGAALLTFRVGLKTNPTLEMPATQPASGSIGTLLRLVDKLGDLMLTPAWNAIRHSAGTQWD